MGKGRMPSRESEQVISRSGTDSRDTESRQKSSYSLVAINSPTSSEDCDELGATSVTDDSVLTKRISWSHL